MKLALSISGVTKDFRIPGSKRWVRAVDNLTLSIRENEVYGLLGPNGSGKSTTIKMALGLMKPSVGECSLFGVASDTPSARLNVGFLPEAPYFQRFLTGRELLRYFAKLAGLSRPETAKRIDALLEKVGLEDAGDRRVGGYSKGMLQRIGLAQALVGDPKLLILDEPTAGVDPVGAAEIASIIRTLKSEGKTVLLCSHLLSQVESVCDRVAIMGRGKRLLEGSIDELTLGTDSSSLQLDGASPELRESVAALAAAEGARVATRRRSLEDLFLELAKGGEGGDD